jgi:hypothetical protein
MQPMEKKNRCVNLIDRGFDAGSLTEVTNKLQTFFRVGGILISERGIYAASQFKTIAALKRPAPPVN